MDFWPELKDCIEFVDKYVVQRYTEEEQHKKKKADTPEQEPLSEEEATYLMSRANTYTEQRAIGVRYQQNYVPPPGKALTGWGQKFGNGCLPTPILCTLEEAKERRCFSKNGTLSGLSVDQVQNFFRKELECTCDSCVLIYRQFKLLGWKVEAVKDFYNGMVRDFAKTLIGSKQYIRI